MSLEEWGTMKLAPNDQEHLSESSILVPAKSNLFSSSNGSDVFVYVFTVVFASVWP